MNVFCVYIFFFFYLILILCKFFNVLSNETRLFEFCQRILFDDSKKIKPRNFYFYFVFLTKILLPKLLYFLSVCYQNIYLYKNPQLK